MFVTIFMALLSTTVATIVAAPLSFLAASNITRRGALGTTVYYVTRSFFNLLRSYDPLVMATVFGFWLSFGPFPGFFGPDRGDHRLARQAVLRGRRRH